MLKRPLTRLALAVRLREAVLPALGNPKLFKCEVRDHGCHWLSESFHIASLVTPHFASFEVWPIRHKSGLAKYYNADGKVMNLHRSPYGQFELVSFRHGDWEKDLLRYVGAPLGLLTLRPCGQPQSSAQR